MDLLCPWLIFPFSSITRQSVDFLYFYAGICPVRMQSAILFLLISFTLPEFKSCLHAVLHVVAPSFGQKIKIDSFIGKYFSIFLEFLFSVCVMSYDKIH